MTSWKCAAVLIALAGLNATSSHATEGITGRWAADTSSCEGFAAKPPLVVTNYAVRWSGEACRIGRMYKNGDTVHIQALCWGETGEKSITVALHPQGGRLSVGWDRGARSTLQGCP